MLCNILQSHGTPNMYLPGIDGTRLEDQLQQAEAFRSHDRVESSGPVDGQEVLFADGDPWAAGYEPWPAPTFTTSPNSLSDTRWSKGSLGDITNQIFGVK